MVTTTKKIIGVLVLLIASTLIVVMNMEHGLKIDVSKNETVFYIYYNASNDIIPNSTDSYGYDPPSSNEGSWVLSGRESWMLYSNNKYYKPSSATLKNTVLKNNKTEITRTVKYRTINSTIIDKYMFDGNEKDIELFPIQHNINITCKNCTYKYIYGMYSNRMKMSFDTPDSITNNTLIYNIKGNRILNIRMFDPIWNVSGNYTYNTPSLDPDPAYVSSELNCSIYLDMTNFTNISYTPGVNYTVYFWYFKNNVQQTAYSSLLYYNSSPVVSYAPMSIPSPLGINDIWHCRIRATTTSGAILYTTPVMLSNYVNISNSGPTITAVSPVSVNETTPTTVYTTPSTNPTLTWIGSDINNDTLRYEVYGGELQQ